MHPDLRDVPEHIRALAKGALAHANWHANYFSPENPFWNELSVMQAAHAMELFVKARIAQEHPLLIFERVSPIPSGTGELLDLKALAENGRTYSYRDLPGRLWASTGITIKNISIYNSFGKLRNTIQHFTIPDGSRCGDAAIEFIYEVIDPFINECWGYFAVDYNEDTEPHLYLIEGLIRRGVEFLVSPEAAEFVLAHNQGWKNERYRRLMMRRARAAG